MASRSAISIIAAALFAAVLADNAAAQVLYKSTMQNGRVVYGNKPEPDAAKVEEIQAPPPAPVNPAQSANESTQSRRTVRQSEQRGRERAVALDDAYKELMLAREALAKAQERRTTGEEPAPNERDKTPIGSRLNGDYYERLKTLDINIEEAQKRVDRAQARFNDLR